MSDYITATTFSKTYGFKPSEWPTSYLIVPRIGDCVFSNNNDAILKIDNVIHGISDGKPTITLTLVSVKD